MGVGAAVVKYIVRLALLVCTTGALASCDSASTNGTYSNGGVFVPTAASGVQISVSLLPSAITSTGLCSTGALTTSVELVVVPSREAVAVDSVTLHMIDGSNIGGPGITFPSSQLVQMFGTTAVVQPRAFVFQASFVCPAATPRSVTADVIVIDGSGNSKRLAASAAFH
jgi:hypothetical protein